METARAYCSPPSALASTDVPEVHHIGATLRAVAKLVFLRPIAPPDRLGLEVLDGPIRLPVESHYVFPSRISMISLPVDLLSQKTQRTP